MSANSSRPFPAVVLTVLLIVAAGPAAFGADGQAPSVTNLSASSSVAIGSASVLEVTGEADDSQSGGSVVIGGEMFVGEDPGEGLGSAMRAGDGMFDSSTEWLAGTLDVSGWGEGIYRIGVRAVDSRGNWGGVATMIARCGEARAFRELPDFYVAGSAVDVTVSVAPDGGVSDYSVWETPPAGWTVTAISGGGSWQAGSVTWGPFAGDEPRVLTYRATPPVGDTGTKTFSGAVHFQGASYETGGDLTIEHGRFHPADSGENWSINAAEADAYSNAWRSGAAWPVAPSAIPVSHVTNAAWIAAIGRGYAWAGGAEPSCWRAVDATSEPQAGTLVRTLPESYQGGVSFTVSIVVRPTAETTVWAAEDMPPTGWLVTAVSDSGTWDAAHGLVKWGPFASAGSKTLTYSVTPPPSAMGHKPFDGSGGFDGAVAVTGGDTVAVAVDTLAPTVGSVGIVPSMVREGIDEQILLTAVASDELTGESTIAAAEFFVGADPGVGSGTPMSAADGAFDSTVEGLTAHISVVGWQQGTYRLNVRARDLAGLWSMVSHVDVPVVDGVPPGAVYDLAAESVASFKETPATVCDYSGEDVLARAANASDNDVRTFWQTDGSVVERIEHLTLDAGETLELAAVGFTGGRTKALFPSEFVVDVSVDGSEWSQVALAEGFRAGAGQYVWQFETVQARYVRISGPGVYFRRERHWLWQIGEARLYTADSGAIVQLQWTAPADDYYTGNPADRYDLRYSRYLISADGFDSCTCCGGGEAPLPPGRRERRTLEMEEAGSKLYFAMKTADIIPNWSMMSNVAEVEAGVAGFALLQPVDCYIGYADMIPRFEFAAGPMSPVRLEFSSSPGFPTAPLRLEDGSVVKTARFGAKADIGRWMPSRAQWKMIKSLADEDGLVRWRLSGKSRDYGWVHSVFRTLCFHTGAITDLAVEPRHSLGADPAVWPGPAAPGFSWSDATERMDYLWIDVSTDELMPLSDRKSTVTLGGRGIDSDVYTPTRGEWRRVRRLASGNAGVLWWRVRAAGRDRVLTCLSETQRLVIDGGEWTLFAPAIDADTGTLAFSWSHDGEGIECYRLEFSSDPTFPDAARYTTKAPLAPTLESAYTLTAGDTRRLQALAARNDVATLHWRVVGEDVDRAFTTASHSATMAVP